MQVERIAAFTAEGNGGNPAGVVVADAHPGEAEMQRIARDLGYSETVFAASRQDGKWRVRYFSPEAEVAFCGHATVALGAVLGHRFGAGRFELVLNGGEISVEAGTDGGATLTSPPTRSAMLAPALRDEIMARINAAYRNGNGLVIESLIEEYQQRAEVGEEDAATRLIRTIRTIARMRDQIRETEAAILTLRDSELVRLQKIVIEAEARGVDKLAELAAGVERQIAEAEVRLERIRKYAAAAATVTLEPVPSARTAQRTVAEKKVEAGLVDPPAAGSPVAQTFRSVRGEELERAAELYIADQLHAAGQDYAYRQPCVLAAGQCLRVPDFTVLDAESKPLLWFHQPEMDAEAREDWQADLAAYAALGFETGINLFVTRDDETGAVDEMRLRKMVLFVLSLARS